MVDQRLLDVLSLHPTLAPEISDRSRHGLDLRVRPSRERQAPNALLESPSRPRRERVRLSATREVASASYAGTNVPGRLPWA